MPGIDKLTETVGIVKVPHSPVALAQLKQSVRIDNAGQAAQDKKNEDFYIQLFMYEAKSVHIALL